MIRPVTPADQQLDNPASLIPARMLNEFSYCPRLGYLEFVDGEWDDNLFTKQGTFGHRRVDKADRKNIASPSDQTKDTADSNDQREKVDASDSSTSTCSPKPSSAEAAHLHAKSVMLSAPVEGLIAKLDVLELDGSVATPVDYKRGQAPKVAEGAYEPERVQLCAQGLILRENGFESTEGVLYFISSKKRVTIPFTDELIERTRTLLQEFRDTINEEVIPPPLVDSPKCPGCSLVGICLPDETTLLQVGLPTDESDVDTANEAGTTGDAESNFPGDRMSRSAKPVRMLFAARNDAQPLYVQEYGATIGKSGERLVVRKKKQTVAERRLMDVSQISLFGNVSLTAPALSEVLNRNISVCHFSYGGWFRGITSGLAHNNVQLRIRQYAIAADSAQSMDVARQMISGKIRNSRTLLRRHLPREDNLKLLDQLNRYRLQAEQTDNADSLFGIEGMAAKVYFEGLFRLIGQRHNFDVSGRNRRPPKDPVNAVLSFAYALLTKELTITLQSVGFDPMLGIFHRPRFGRPSLALDMAEEYRPLIADSVMLTVFNNGELNDSHFLQRAGAVTFTSAGRSSLIAAFERRMNTEVTHPIFGYKLSYRRLLEVQCRLLARTMLGEIEAYPAFTTR